jgi:hypothetical protein
VLERTLFLGLQRVAGGVARCSEFRDCSPFVGTSSEVACVRAQHLAVGRRLAKVRPHLHLRSTRWSKDHTLEVTSREPIKSETQVTRWEGRRELLERREEAGEAAHQASGGPLGEGRTALAPFRKPFAGLQHRDREPRSATANAGESSRRLQVSRRRGRLELDLPSVSAGSEPARV